MEGLKSCSNKACSSYGRSICRYWNFKAFTYEHKAKPKSFCVSSSFKNRGTDPVDDSYCNEENLPTYENDDDMSDDEFANEETHDGSSFPVENITDNEEGVVLTSDAKINNVDGDEFDIISVYDEDKDEENDHMEDEYRITEHAQSAALAAEEGVEGAVPVMLHRAKGQTLSVVQDDFNEKVKRLVVDSPQHIMRNRINSETKIFMLGAQGPRLLRVVGTLDAEVVNGIEDAHRGQLHPPRARPWQEAGLRAAHHLVVHQQGVRWRQSRWLRRSPARGGLHAVQQVAAFLRRRLHRILRHRADGLDEMRAPWLAGVSGQRRSEHRSQLHLQDEIALLEKAERMGSGRVTLGRGEALGMGAKRRCRGKMRRTDYN
ncbi:unnamed protein product [Miscanthus lutarioriparius]|uniref:Uncharacterized protein n=1 Tax=Miscanthus lutarioriparius TaxID=422564 RepID=A0A811SGA5_9POAL|nr:unnamed protein product [Miscanthus lutarioriparius]